MKLKVMFYMGISPVPKVEHFIFKVKSRGYFIENLYIPHLSGAYMRLNHFHKNLDLYFYKIHASKGLYRNSDELRSKESKLRKTQLVRYQFWASRRGSYLIARNQLPNPNDESLHYVDHGIDVLSFVTQNIGFNRHPIMPSPK